MRPREFLPRDFFGLPADDDDEAIIGRGPNISLRERAALLAERRLSQPVGEGKPNEPDDVAQVETLVRSTGDLDFRSGHEPTSLFSVPLRDAIRGFQRRSNLALDGIVNPNGETLQTLTREIVSDDFANGASVDSVNDTDDAGRRCNQLANEVANARRNLDRWLQIEQEDEALVRAAEEHVEDARAALAVAVGGGTVPERITRGLRRGSILGLGMEAVEIARATAELATAENELERLRNQQFATTKRNVRSAEARWQTAQATFRQQCG